MNTFRALCLCGLMLALSHNMLGCNWASAWYDAHISTHFGGANAKADAEEDHSAATHSINGIPEADIESRVSSGTHTERRRRTTAPGSERYETTFQKNVAEWDQLFESEDMPESQRTALKDMAKEMQDLQEEHYDLQSSLNSYQLWSRMTTVGMLAILASLLIFLGLRYRTTQASTPLSASILSEESAE